jgi:hypothetical protein
LGYNLNLAYSMLVYCLESLCQHATESPARWEDYDPSVRAELDPLLAHIDATRAEEIQGILLRAAAVRLQRRFIGFAEQHTTDAFFVQEAAGLRPALRRSHYSRALRNAYTMRSRYVHGLEPIQEQLLVPAVAAADYFPWQGEPFLTLAGLLRVTRHVIGTFIQRSEAVESEDVDWRSQLPGTVAFEAAPRYWVWKAENFSPKQAFRRLSGFLSHFDGIRDDDGKSIVDLSNLMEVVERSLPLANAEQRRAMLVMYCLYNTVVIPEGRRENWEQVVDKHSDELGPSIETLVGTVVLGHEPEGPLQEWLSAYRAYQSTRFRKSTVRIPVLMEIEVLSALANKALGEGDHELHKELLTTAIWEAGGYSAVQKYLIGIRDASEPVVRDALRAAEKEDRGARE